MKIAPICLLTACKRRKFKLFGDSSQVPAIDNGITCCYWSASLSNQLGALKVHSSLFKCCAKNCPNYMYWIQGKHCGSWVWVFLQLSVSLKLIFILFLFFFNSPGRVPLTGNSLRAEKSHWQVQKVTLAGPKSHTRAKMSHWSVIIWKTVSNWLLSPHIWSGALTATVDVMYATMHCVVMWLAFFKVIDSLLHRSQGRQIPHHNDCARGLWKSLSL